MLERGWMCHADVYFRFSFSNIARRNYSTRLFKEYNYSKFVRAIWYSGLNQPIHWPLYQDLVGTPAANVGFHNNRVHHHWGFQPQLMVAETGVDTGVNGDHLIYGVVGTAGVTNSTIVQNKVVCKNTFMARLHYLSSSLMPSSSSLSF